MDVIAIVIAGLALLFSVVTHLSARKGKERTAFLEEQNAKLAERQTQLAHRSWSDEHFREVTRWATEVVLVLSKARHISSTSDAVSRESVLVALSACIDMGRWFFPNVHEDGYGQEKEPAYRGLRQPLLDSLVEAYGIIDGEKKVQGINDELLKCQRHFVSAIQEHLDPRRRTEEVSRVWNAFEGVAGLPKIEKPKQ